MSSIHPSDTLYVYDGTDTNAPLLGAYNNITDPSLALLPIEATLNNPSGCLTIRFVSGPSNENNGFHAEITCEKLCQEIIAELDLALTSPTPDTNYIAICPGTEINFSANASFPENNIFYDQSEATTTFEWVFGDGTTATGENVSHTYDAIGGYTVSLFATDPEGCVSSNSIETRIVIAGNPYSNSNPPAPICANDTLQMDFDMLGIGGTIVEGTPFHEEITTTLGVSDTTFLPDGTGDCYETSVIFNCFDPGQTLDNPQDFLNLAVNMEHSFIGDLEISIICPNNQTLTLKSFSDPAGNNGYGGSTFMGEPIDDDTNLNPGVGHNYSWTPITPAFGTMGAEADAMAGGTVPEGSYEPSGTFYDLVGCPLNGQWTIEICDNWGSDNGYIFSWEMTLNPDIAPDSWDYTVPIDQYSWTSGPHIIDQTEESITISPPVSGTFDYTYNIVDLYGCSWDTTISVEVLNSPVVNLGPDLTFCPGGTNSHTFNAMNPGNNYTWQDNSTNSTFTATTPGTYSVTVSNGLCEDFDEATIFPHSGFTLSENHTDVTCFGGADGTITVQASSDYPPYFYNWSDGQIGEQATGLAIGNYEVTIIDNNGCETTTDATIEEPTELTATHNTTVISCYGGDDGEIDLSVQGGIPPYTYQWSNGDTSQDLDSLFAGDYSVLIKDANNCLLSLLIPVSQTEKIETALPGEHYYCSEFEEILSSSATGGTAPYTYLWSDLSTGESLSISPTESTVYRVTVTDAQNCTIVDEASVLVYPELELISTVQEDSVCIGETTIVNIDITGGSGTYTSFLNGSQTSFPIEVDPSVTPNLNIEVKDNCFHSITDQLIVYNHPTPEANFQSDIREGCPPLAIQFNYNNDCSDCSYLWEFSNGTNTPNTAIEENPIYTFDNSGKYNVRLIVENKYGCKNEMFKFQNIHAFSKPKADYLVTPDITSIITPNISFKNQSEDATRYVWEFGNGSSSEETNPYFQYQNVGEYESQLIAFSREGCTDTSRFVVKIKEELTFYVPEAFTPDNDGKNEVFNIFGNGIKEEGFSLQVYNRWGEMIFETNDLKEGWSGRVFNGTKIVQSGNYTWVCIYKDIYDTQHEKSGVVSLIR